MSTNEPGGTLPDMLTPRESMAMTRLSRSNTYRKLRNGDIPSVKFGRRWLIRKVDLIRLLTPEGVR